MNTRSIPPGSIIEITDHQKITEHYLLCRCAEKSFVLIELETGIRWSSAQGASSGIVDHELLELMIGECDSWTVLEDKKAVVVDKSTPIDTEEQTMNLPTFKLHVMETSTTVIEVQASTLEEAKEKAYDLWEDGMISFNHVEMNFEHIPTQYYGIGDKIYLPHSNSTLIIAQIAPGTLMLIDVNTGNRWNDEHLTDAVQATNEEIEWMVNPPSSHRDRYEWYTA